MGAFKRTCILGTSNRRVRVLSHRNSSNVGPAKYHFYNVRARHLYVQRRRNVRRHVIVIATSATGNYELGNVATRARNRISSVNIRIRDLLTRSFAFQYMYGHRTVDLIQLCHRFLVFQREDTPEDQRGVRNLCRRNEASNISRRRFKENNQDILLGLSNVPANHTSVRFQLKFPFNDEFLVLFFSKRVSVAMSFGLEGVASNQPIMSYRVAMLTRQACHVATGHPIHNHPVIFCGEGTSVCQAINTRGVNYDAQPPDSSVSMFLHVSRRLSLLATILNSAIVVRFGSVRFLSNDARVRGRRVLIPRANERQLIPVSNDLCSYLIKDKCVRHVLIMGLGKLNCYPRVRHHRSNVIRQDSAR